jgi:hypothetical protein
MKLWDILLKGPTERKGTIGLANSLVGVNPGKGEASTAGHESFSAMWGAPIAFG